jgi:hypothetical protein
MVRANRVLTLALAAGHLPRKVIGSLSRSVKF